MIMIRLLVIFSAVAEKGWVKEIISSALCLFKGMIEILRGMFYENILKWSQLVTIHKINMFRSYLELKKDVVRTLLVGKGDIASR